MMGTLKSVLSLSSPLLTMNSAEESQVQNRKVGGQGNQARGRREVVEEVVSLELVERDSQGASSIDQAAVKARERYDLSLLSEKIDRRQMKGVQRSHRYWERLQGPCEHRRRKLSQGNTAQEVTHLIRV